MDAAPKHSVSVVYVNECVMQGQEGVGQERHNYRPIIETDTIFI